MPTDYNVYWKENTFWLAERVANVRRLLKPKMANTEYARFGSKGDGGYILANDIKFGDTLISYGVDKNIDFEKDLADRGCNVVMYDHSVDGPPEPINGIFIKKKIGLNSDEISIDDTLTESNCILKIDIEGSEWDTLAVARKLSQCRQITMEAHWLFNLPYDAYYNKVIEALENINKTHFSVWVHANNDQPLAVMGAQPIPNVFEVLFLNKESYLNADIRDPFEGLVVPNNPAFPEIGLTFP